MFPLENQPRQRQHPSVASTDSLGDTVPSILWLLLRRH